MVIANPVMRRGTCHAAVLAAWLALGCGAATDTAGEETAAESQPLVSSSLANLDLEANGPYPVVTGEYALPAAVDSRVLVHEYEGEPVKTDVRGKIYLPQVDGLPEGQGAFGTGPFPVAVFLHGNHSTCRLPSNTDAPDRDQGYQFTYSGTCPEGEIEAPSYLGYEYAAQHLATHGYAVVSINANRGVTGGSSPPHDPYAAVARGELVLKHLSYLQRWNNGEPVPDDGTLELALTGALDFSHVGLVGHSMGGMGVRAAYDRLMQPPDGSYAQDVSGLEVEGIFEFAPSDVPRGGIFTALDTHWAVVIGSCDNEVHSYAGAGVYARRRAQHESATAGSSSIFVVPGANHAYFNEQWTYVDVGSTDCPAGQLYLWDPRSEAGDYSMTTRGNERQRRIGLMTLSAFFRGYVGAGPDAAVYRRVFDAQFELPTQLGDLVDAQRETVVHSQAEALVALDSSHGTGFDYEVYGSPSYTRAVRDIQWDEGTGGAQYDLLWQLGQSLQDVWAFSTSLARYHEGPMVGGQIPGEQLDPYADQPLGGSLQLILADGSVSSPVSLTDYVTLTNRVNELYFAGGTLSDRESRRVVFQEVAVTTHDFALAEDQLAMGLRFTFAAPAAGRVMLDKTVFARRRIQGDANGDGVVDIVDALLTSQYYVGLGPTPFFPSAADVDCNGAAEIVDALLIAQHYVGLLESFPCDHY